MSPSVQCLSVRMPRCSFQPILTGTNHLPYYASLPAGMGSIPSGIDLFNSDLAGMPLSLLCYSLLYIQYICNNVAIVFNYLSMTTIVSLLLFIILFLSIIVMYLHHYLIRSLNVFSLSMEI